MSGYGNSGNQPVATKKFDRVQVAIFKQASEPGENAREWYSVALSRSYRDASGDWQRIHSFNERDLPHVKLGVEWAMRELQMLSE